MIIQDSAKFWFPKLLAPGPFSWLVSEVPATIFVDYDESLLEPSLYGTSTREYDRLYYAVHTAINWKYPAFLRTDLTSAKHKGKNACRLENEEELNQLLLTLLSHAHLKSYHSKVKSSAILIRPWLDLAHRRTAFGGMPVGNELRVFADQKDVQCWHYYWPQEALADHMDDGNPPDMWQLSSWIRTDVQDAARAAAKAMGVGKWSIDFAEDATGKYWLLDMATAGNSYHASECKHAGLDQENRL